MGSKQILREMFFVLAESLKSENVKEQMLNTYQKQLELYQKLKNSRDEERVCARCLLSLYRCFLSCDDEESRISASYDILKLNSFIEEGRDEEIKLRAESLKLKPSNMISDSVLFLYHSAMPLNLK